MGTVIRFPIERRTARKTVSESRRPEETASIILLPVVRIERWDQSPKRRARDKTSQVTNQ
jgi:hypothetical protein